MRYVSLAKTCIDIPSQEGLSNSHSPFLKAESELRFWLSSQRTDGSSFSSKSQFFDRSSSSELIGTTFTSLWGHEIFTSVWNFLNFWGETFFGELFLFSRVFLGLLFILDHFKQKKNFEFFFSHEFTLFICGFEVDQFFWEPPRRFFLTERENHRTVCFLNSWPQTKCRVIYRENKQWPVPERAVVLALFTVS